MKGHKPAANWFRKGRTLTIRGRLALSFFTVLALFGLNQAVYSYSNRRRKATVEALRRAISSQILIAAISRRLNDTQKQIALINQAVTDSGVGASPQEIASFRVQINVVGDKIRNLSALSDPEPRRFVDQFAKDYEALTASWVIFYEDFGVHYAAAITELAMRGDPLSQRLLMQTVPQILDAEKRRVEKTSATSYEVGAWADRYTAFIFLYSGMVALVIAFRLSRHLDRGLSDLKTGADLIGSGALDHHIGIRSDDELGDVANTFNHMSAQLRTARSSLTHANEELASRHAEVQRQREVSGSLLLNILPARIAGELRDKHSVDPKYFEDVTILFTDFVGFSNSTRHLSAEDLVYLLHGYFADFDNIVTRYGLEKLKTIGDSYMCVGGMPTRTPSHPVDTVMAAFEMLEAVRQRAQRSPSWEVRIGIHTGAAIAGVVGIKKFAFDIWGESVNLASRMESSGGENRINISQQTHARVKDFFCLRGARPGGHERQAGARDVFRARRSSLIGGLDGKAAPRCLLPRYGIYFQKEPPAFPASLL